MGPIDDFTRHSRKTIDFWSGSFIFSYLMAETARKISSFGAEIFLPSLENNPLCFGDGIVTCGSVPDQIYVLLNDDNKAEIEDVLKDVISETLKDVVGKIEAKKGSNIDLCEINNFFNFFHIIHEIKNHYPTHKEFIEAEQKIKMRAAIRPFNQLKDQEWIPKWKKCSLCGDRKGVYSEPVDKKDAGHYEEEHICNVCILKRCLPKIVKEIVPKIDKRIVEKSHYQSTSDIALSPIKVIIDDNERKEFGPLIDKCKKETEGIDISEGRYFYDVSFKKRFANWREDLLEKYPELSWLDRPFYSIVYMDGDNMGEILKGSFPCIKDISKILSQFSNAVSDIVSDHHGQLIFAGGEDVNFIIHPEYLLDCIDELNGCYKGLMGNISEKSTLSAGAIVCYHKYPLSQAILKAGKMLHDHAKKYSGKNATAISLIKGHRETTSLTISNSKIKTLEKLKESLLQTDISRTTPYRIKKEIDILNRLADLSQRRNYLYAIIAGTRGLERTNKKIEELVDLLMEFGDVQTAINALLYTRFLIGEKKNA
ncbi:type III-B CRISPR-associated protein Cas10/Cmr2, partial [bacterium]|nr:type III-B CRISPR-associated protein Cas10/Cmr2 [bacterium]